MTLTASQMKFMRELERKGNLKLPSNNRTANALARKGLVHFVVYFGWVPTSAGIDINQRLREVRNNGLS